MNNKELMEIALNYIEKGYNADKLRDGDDLYNATADDKDKCIEYYIECQRIGTVAFKELIDKEI